jgi:hypothetical protein
MLALPGCGLALRLHRRRRVLGVTDGDVAPSSHQLCVREVSERDVSHVLSEVPLVTFKVDRQVHAIAKRKIDGFRDDLHTR